MRIATLLILLALAAVVDAREQRVPNGIPASLLLAAVVLGLAADGAAGGLRALAGGAVGLCALLPLYALRGMGAGDVKLMAGTGALLGGPAAALFAAGATLICGGLLAAAYLAARLAAASARPAAPAAPPLAALRREAGRSFPYALAVLGGALMTLAAAPRLSALGPIG